MSKSNTQQFNLSRGYLFALISSAFLSTTAIFIRHLSQTYHVPSLVVAFWRDAFAVITLLTVLGFVQPRLLRMERRHLFYMAGYGFVLAFFNAFWTLSVSLNGAAIATVLVIAPLHSPLCWVGGYSRNGWIGLNYWRLSFVWEGVRWYLAHWNKVSGIPTWEESWRASFPVWVTPSTA